MIGLEQSAHCANLHAWRLYDVLGLLWCAGKALGRVLQAIAELWCMKHVIGHPRSAVFSPVMTFVNVTVRTGTVRDTYDKRSLGRGLGT